VAANGNRTTEKALLIAGSAAAGLAGGIALAGRKRPRLLRRKSGLVMTAEAVGSLAKQLGQATDEFASAGSDVRRLRAQLEQMNRRSPVEVVVDALTHRRGAHRREGGY
jgi:hypothetical protein